MLISTAVCPRAHAQQRWPAWPTEIAQIAAPLIERSPHREAERARLDALERLEPYTDDVATPALVHALSDPSAAVRREALRACFVRQLAACIPRAAHLWSDAQEPTLRKQALRVLALHPDPSRTAIVLGVLRDPNPELRAHAAEILGWAPLPDDTSDTHPRREVEAALLAKLSDADSQVRRVAVRSLGQLGPGEGTLAITRLLEDPEPTVRTAAAVALARRRDVRAVPPLLRAFAAPNEPEVRTALLTAISRLPGPEVTRTLLNALDAPPPGLTYERVAEIIGTRPEPDGRLIEGLIDRLADAALTSASLHALLLLGEPAVPHIERAIQDGVDPALEDALRRVRAASASQPRASSGPSITPGLDADLTRTLLRSGSPRQWLPTAIRLAETSPPWLEASLRAQLETWTSLDGALPWLAVLAGRSVPAASSSWEPWARVIGWAAEPNHDLGARCLALAALASVPPPHRARLHEELRPFVRRGPPLLRACAAQTAARTDAIALAGLALLDPNPRVRASAIHGFVRPPPTLAARIELLEHTDPASEVRVAAHAARGTEPRRLELRWVPTGAVPWARPAVPPRSPVLGRASWVLLEDVYWSLIPQELDN